MRRLTTLIGILYCAAAVQGQTNADAAWDILNAGLKDKNPDKRKAAVTAIGTIGFQERPVQILENALVGDLDPDVRQAAAAMLGEMKSTSSIPKLKDALAKQDESSFAAARALWNMGDHSGRALFEDTAGGERKDAAGAVAQARGQARKTLHDPSAMAKMGADSAAEALLGPFAIGLKLAVELRKDQGAPARLISINLLAQECSPETVKVLETVVGADKNDAVRAAAALGLGSCGTEASEAKLQPLLAFDKYSITLVAAASIVRIESRIK